MVTLAAFRYRNVLAQYGGPIGSLEVASTCAGQFQANAWLADNRGSRPKARALYGACHGTGTHASALVARFIAISEALERWAHYAIESGQARSTGGFEIDPSSNGMAAYPGFTHRPARRCALLEAIERASLFDWWEGRAPGRRVESESAGVGAVRLDNPFRVGVTAITFREFAPGWFSYGHAAAMEWRDACDRARIEMDRGAMVLERYRVLRAAGKAIEPVDLFERRCVFFASTRGHELFLERLHTAPTAFCRSWRIAFDREIKGPWSRYATVWRVVIPPATSDYLAADERYFFW